MSDEKSVTQANAEEWMRLHKPDQWLRGQDGQNSVEPYRPSGWTEGLERSTFDKGEK